MELKKYFPVSTWLPETGRAAFTGDVLAGMVTAILMVPQGLAFAMVAGLPPQIGLYAAILPPLLYALLGTSRGLSVGPTSVVSIMVAAAVSNAVGPADAVEYAGALAAMTGLILFLMGLLRLGLLANLLSSPVLTGFSSGAAVVIIADQVKHLAGLPLPTGLHPHETFAYLLARPGQVNWETLSLGLGCIVFLAVAARPLPAGMRRRIGYLGSTLVARVAPLVLVVASSVIVARFDMDVALVGKVQGGLPDLFPGLPAPGTWLDLLPSAALISVIAFVESVTIGKYLGSLARQQIDSNQELVALGTANLGAAFTGAMPVAGSFSRSIVNVNAGAATQIAGIVMALIVAVAAAFLGPAFEHLPRAALSAIMIVAVADLIDLRSVMETWRYSKSDATTNIATFIGTLAYGVEAGLVIGVVLSLLLYIWRTSQPNIAVVGRMPETGQFRSSARHSVETWPEILLVRVDENLYFANVGYVWDIVAQEIQRRPGLKHLVLVLSGVGFIDTSALKSAVTAAETLKELGITLNLAEVKGPVMDRLRKTHLAEQIEPGRFFPTAQMAVNELSRDVERDRELIPI
jgi:SulP family sulfate permease